MIDNRGLSLLEAIIALSLLTIASAGFGALVQSSTLSQQRIASSLDVMGVQSNLNVLLKNGSSCEVSFAGKTFGVDAGGVPSPNASFGDDGSLAISLPYGGGVYLEVGQIVSPGTSVDAIKVHKIKKIGQQMYLGTLMVKTVGQVIKIKEIEFAFRAQFLGGVATVFSCIQDEPAPDVYEFTTPAPNLRQCQNVDVFEKCGDGDGCEVRMYIQNETTDESRYWRSHLYYEQDDLSNHIEAGVRASGVQDGYEISAPLGTGTFNRYMLSASIHNYVIITNYKRFDCVEQFGVDGPAHSNPYRLTINVHQDVKARVYFVD